MDYDLELRHYLDAHRRLKEWPSHRNKGRFQQLALEYLASKFEPGIRYHENLYFFMPQLLNCFREML
jgi:hypothetical protein